MNTSAPGEKPSRARAALAMRMARASLPRDGGRLARLTLEATREALGAAWPGIAPEQAVRYHFASQFPPGLADVVATLADELAAVPGGTGGLDAAEEVRAHLMAALVHGPPFPWLVALGPLARAARAEASAAGLAALARLMEEMAEASDFVAPAFGVHPGKGLVSDNDNRRPPG